MSVGNILGASSVPFAPMPMNAASAMRNISGTPDPITLKPSPVRPTMSELGQRAASHPLIPVPIGGGMISEMSGAIDSLDLIRGMDELIGRTDMKIGEAMSRALAGRRRAGDISTTEACGPMSGPIYA